MFFSQNVGELEVPVLVMKGLDDAVIRTAPFFTNVKALWQNKLRQHEDDEVGGLRSGVGEGKPSALKRGCLLSNHFFVLIALLREID